MSHCDFNSGYKKKGNYTDKGVFCHPPQSIFFRLCTVWMQIYVSASFTTKLQTNGLCGPVVSKVFSFHLKGGCFQFDHWHSCSTCQKERDSLLPCGPCVLINPPDSNSTDVNNWDFRLTALVLSVLFMPDYVLCMYTYFCLPSFVCLLEHHILSN